TLPTPHPTKPTPLPYTTLFRSGPPSRRTARDSPSPIPPARPPTARTPPPRPPTTVDVAPRAEPATRVGPAPVPPAPCRPRTTARSEEHTSELQSLAYLVCRLLL